MALYYVGDTTGEVEKQLAINYSDFGRIQTLNFKEEDTFKFLFFLNPAKKR